MTLLLLALLALPSRAADYDDAARSARKLLSQLVAADTSNPPGNEERAVKLGAQMLKSAKIQHEVVAFAPGRQDLVARLKGSGSEKPLLLLAHVDVVGTQDQKWTTAPHQLTEKADMLLGRGVLDDLSMAAISLEVMRLLQREHAKLRRDVIMAWTGDEESGGAGIRYLLDKRRGLIDAGLALNEGGGLILDENGKLRVAQIQVGEKTYQDYELVTRGPTGHSSVPQTENAIYRLSRALSRLSHSTPPARLTPATRAFLKGQAEVESPDVAKAMRELADAQGEPLPAESLAMLEQDPAHAATLHTTCVATMVQGGTRENALPAEARANINCRILPGETPDDVRRWITNVIMDPQVDIRMTKDYGVAEASPVEGEAMAAILSVVGKMWPGTPVVPSVSAAATDSRHLRAAGIPSYGIDPVPVTEADALRAHGADERIPAASLRQGVEFMHRLVLELAGPK